MAGMLDLPQLSASVRKCPRRSAFLQSGFPSFCGSVVLAAPSFCGSVVLWLRRSAAPSFRHSGGPTFHHNSL